ncbi:hypothetical protein [Xanthomonas vesicatoria]|uniref:hypothetical protein n=1 Tax=Xanthomonas vesicatoria TaxID=56460 RepID=UPI000F8EFA1B|nr:hypothetical protein [Xanthomonas vesicatoria]MCC8558608.1 hypothetical protein [Xanthomonas vesicatoria]MCC8599441.1 hypothetical protein [Xanthomonas vesicatoria]MCC8608664.1 hypothetical protein [Xanthomonas vesicatoria]MCC8672986.1 hypothetical protein [Xanthomonas vesicatoria]MCC8678984.1 hypothetical protein [Xanthomonas vesicatoria]
MLYDFAGTLTSAGNRGGREQCNADRAENQSIAKGCMVAPIPVRWLTLKKSQPSIDEKQAIHHASK